MHIVIGPQNATSAAKVRSHEVTSILLVTSTQELPYLYTLLSGARNNVPLYCSVPYILSKMAATAYESQDFHGKDLHPENESSSISTHPLISPFLGPAIVRLSPLASAFLTLDTQISRVTPTHTHCCDTYIIRSYSMVAGLIHQICIM